MNTTSIVVLTPDQLTDLMKQAAFSAVSEYVKNHSKPAVTEDKMLTPKEVAKRLRKSRQTVANWIKSGRLVSEKINRNVFIKESDLDAALKSGGNS